RLVNASEGPLQELLFWLYPNRYRERPPSLGDVGFDWLYPDGFSPGSMAIHAVRVGTAADGGVGAAATPGPVAPASFSIEGSAAGRETLLRVRLPAGVA